MACNLLKFILALDESSDYILIELKYLNKITHKYEENRFVYLTVANTKQNEQTGASTESVPMIEVLILNLEIEIKLRH